MHHFGSALPNARGASRHPWGYSDTGKISTFVLSVMAFLKFFGRQAEFVFRFRCDGNRHAARHTGQRVVAHKARLRDNNLIALAHKAAQRTYR